MVRMNLFRPAPCAWAFSLALLCALPADGQEETAAVPRLVLEDLEGGRRELDAAGLVLEDPRAGGAWLVRPVGFPPAQPATGRGELVEIELGGGDALRGRIAGGAGEVLFLELIGGVRLPVDVSAMRRIVLPQRLPARRLVALEAPPEGDRLYRRTSRELDRIDGTLEAFVDEGIRFESVLGAKTFPWSEVAALFVEVLDEPEGGADGERVPVVVDLVDGSRLRGELVRLDGRVCRLVVAGSELALDWSTVLEVVVDDGSLVFLSELAPLGEEGKGAPFGDEVGMVWEHRIDHNVAGGTLTTAGTVWRRGIGMHAPTRVTWELDGGFSRLRGTVGIDDSARWNPVGARGSVVFRVWLDGEPAWESAVVRGGDGALAMPALDVSGVRELVLEADMAGDFRGDRANWIRLLLIR